MKIFEIFQSLFKENVKYDDFHVDHYGGQDDYHIDLF